MHLRVTEIMKGDEGGVQLLRGKGRILDQGGGGASTIACRGATSTMRKEEGITKWWFPNPLSKRNEKREKLDENSIKKKAKQKHTTLRTPVASSAHKTPPKKEGYVDYESQEKL